MEQIYNKIQRCKNIVIKIGTRVLQNESGYLNQKNIIQISSQIQWLKRKNKNIYVVSSGAVGAGRGLLRNPIKKETIITKQVLASMGQSHLMLNYEKQFKKHNMNVGQILLTSHDFYDRKRYVNLQHTLNKMIEMDIIPIINENDSIAVDELKFGDNDLLASFICAIVNADLLIILTDTDGLYKNFKSDNCELIKTITEFNEKEIFSYVVDKKNDVSSGGMKSKIISANVVNKMGIHTYITNGNKKSSIKKVFQPESCLGTLIVSKSNKLSARKRWIGYIKVPKGNIKIDSGAEIALKKDKSLLPVGIIDYEGTFNIGDSVKIVSNKNFEIGRGLVKCDSNVLKHIIGKSNRKKTNNYPYWSGQEIIHKDDLVIKV